MISCSVGTNVDIRRNLMRKTIYHVTYRAAKSLYIIFKHIEVQPWCGRTRESYLNHMVRCPIVQMKRNERISIHTMQFSSRSLPSCYEAFLIHSSGDNL